MTNHDLRAQYGLQDPIQMLAERIDRKIQATRKGHGDPAIRTDRVIEYYDTLWQNLQQSEASQASTVLVETQAQGQHACPTCGLYYPTKKALRQHQALRHGQTQADRVHLEYNKPEQHSISGMPQCRHCSLTLYI